MLLGLCVSLGRIFLDTFATTQGKVLYIDCELHPETFWRRVAAIAWAMGIMRDAIYPHFELLSLRGRNTDLHRLGPLFRRIKPGTYRLIVIDALYRLLPPGINENDNAQMTQIWNLIDAYAAMTKTAIVVVHHASKGNQSEKSVTDVGAGAGAQSRAADAWIVLRAHEQDNAAVLDGAVRSFPPINPIAIQWQYPLWALAPEFDPDDLRVAGRRKHRPEADIPAEPKAEPWTPERFVAAFVTLEPQDKKLVAAKARGAGVKNREVDDLIALAKASGKLFSWSVPGSRIIYLGTAEPVLAGGVK
jgi:hypothetical protein